MEKRPESRCSGLHAGALLCLALGALAGCSRDRPPGWLHLASGFHLESLETPQEPRVTTSSEGVACRLTLEGPHAWLSTDVRRAEWAFRPGLGAWAAAVSIRGVGVPEDGSPAQRLSSPDFDYHHVPARTLDSEYVSTPGDFLFTSGVLFLVTQPDESPPPLVTFSLYTGRGVSTEGGWRLRGQRFSGAALPVWPGEAADREVLALPPSSSLRFATCLEPAVVTPQETLEPVTFRVLLDGAPLFEHQVADPSAETYQWHEVELPPEGRGRVTLRFEVDGPIACTAFAAPVIGPSDVRHYGDRPWGASRPNIVLFLADTFRADSMSAYGGALGLTPHLDELARESLRFRHTRSVSTFTFPSHASMFSGLFPHQAGAIGVRRALPETLVTIAEALGRAGYRTGAITDSAMVSQHYGLDQGFEWFDERLLGLDSTLERARAWLDADDGRPVFLFVHTFRTHTPYKVSEQTRRAYAGVLEIEGEYTPLEERLRELHRDGQKPDLMVEGEARDIVMQMRQHYLGGVVDLDAGFGSFRETLQTREVLANGYLVFTSDHGEAFGEHGELGHAGRVWEEQIRVPLLINGPGLEPRTIEYPASLVDFPRTLAALAGVPAAEGWLGASLLTLRRERPIFAFQCWGEPHEATLAVIDGELKVISYEDPAAIEGGLLLGAYDLRVDPDELRDLTSTSIGWPGDLLRRLGPNAADLLQSVVGPESARLDAGKMAELRALGYVDDED